MLFISEDFLATCNLGGCDEEFVDSSTGLHELRQLMHEGKVRLGTRAVVVCMLGRADVQKGRRIPALVEKFVMSCKTFAPNTYFVLGGPFPGPMDGSRFIRELQGARHYLEQRVTADAMFRSLRVGERFANYTEGVNPRLMSDGGLTVRGSEVLRRDINDVLHQLSE